MNTRNLYGFIFFALLLFCTISPVIAIESDYKFPLMKGTGESIVKIYDKPIWEKVIGQDEYPDDILEGDADEAGARSKATLKEWNDDEIDIFDLIEAIGIFDFDSITRETLKLLLDLNGEWDVWMVTVDQWTYTTTKYDKEPDHKDQQFPLFKDPTAYSEVMDEIKKLIIADELFPITEEDLLYYLVLFGLPAAKPVEDYLNALIEDLGVEDAELNGKILTFKLEREEKFSLVADYTSFGAYNTLKFIDNDDNVFYQINNIPVISGYEFLAFISITLVSILCLIYIISKKRRNFYRNR